MCCDLEFYPIMQPRPPPCNDPINLQFDAAIATLTPAQPLPILLVVWGTQISNIICNLCIVLRMHFISLDYPSRGSANVGGEGSLSGPHTRDNDLHWEKMMVLQRICLSWSYFSHQSKLFMYLDYLNSVFLSYLINYKSSRIATLFRQMTNSLVSYVFQIPKFQNDLSVFQNIFSPCISAGKLYKYVHIYFFFHISLAAVCN